jgi:hypothetical protein
MIMGQSNEKYLIMMLNLKQALNLILKFNLHID